MLGVIYKEICKFTPAHQLHPQAEQESILGHFLLRGEDLEVGVAHLVSK